MTLKNQQFSTGEIDCVSCPSESQSSFGIIFLCAFEGDSLTSLPELPGNRRRATFFPKH
jgi:hypothetical protein